MEFELVDTIEEFKNIENMAFIIWPIAYKDILSINQIRYMLDKYLSASSIKEASNDGYTFIIIKDENNRQLGFMSYKLNYDYIFLSKLYILPNYQGNGIAKEAINYLKTFKLPIELTVNKENIKAIKVYEHIGFKKIKDVVTNIGNSYVMDDYVMRLE